MGSMVATVLWLLASAGFSVYVNNFGSYNKTYGALAGVIVLNLWLYLSCMVILFGAELNAELEAQTKKDSTTGPEQPLGRRGARKADEVGPSTEGSFI
jgi:membrane protein